LRRNVSEEQEKQPPLKFTAIIQKPTVCSNGFLEFDVELRNISLEDVLVEPRNAFYQMHFTKQNGHKVITGDPGPGSPVLTDYIKLKPGESHRQSRKYGLEGKFFQSPGTYKVVLTYGQFSAPSSLPNLFRGTIDSNLILFEEKDCTNGRDVPVSKLGPE
jgi:hypothetical protein